MEQAVNYILESSVSLGVLAIIYRFFLTQSPSITFNRVYILLSLMFSALLPFVHLSWAQSPGSYMLPEVQAGMGYYILESITVWGDGVQQAAYSTLTRFPWMKLIYGGGILMLTGRFLFGLWQIMWFRKGAALEKREQFLLVDTPAQQYPFSFFRLLFVNKQMYDETELKVILNHESTHIRLLHSYDLLLLELILIVQWFNPFVWLLRRYLKEVHEYQADRGTLSMGVELNDYKQVLLVQALGTRIEFGNHFNQLLIKKRLKMMNSVVNKTPGFFKPALLVVTLSLLSFAFGVDRSNLNAMESSPELIHEKNSETVVTQEPVYDKPEVLAKFPGGDGEMMKFMSSNIKYPKEAKEKGVQGKVFVTFNISIAGEVVDVKVARGVHQLLDEEAVRVVKLMPNWTPAKVKGKAVKSSFTLPVNFALEPKVVEVEETKTVEENAPVFFVVEEMPEFTGADAALKTFLIENIRYPEEAKKQNQQGKVFVSFVINPVGKVVNVGLARSSGFDLLDREAMRVIGAMPDWKPGKQRGQAVNVSLVLPVNFSLNAEKPATETTK